MTHQLNNSNECLVCGWEHNKTFKQQLDETEYGIDLIEATDKMGYLLINEILFFNPSIPDSPFHVVCNDVFAWATSDLEPIKLSEIEILFDYVIQDREFGAIKWCVHKRQIQPQKPMVDLMKKHGAFEPWMEELPDCGF